MSLAQNSQEPNPQLRRWARSQNHESIQRASQRPRETGSVDKAEPQPKSRQGNAATVAAITMEEHNLIQLNKEAPNEACTNGDATRTPNAPTDHINTPRIILISGHGQRRFRDNHLPQSNNSRRIRSKTPTLSTEGHESFNWFSPAAL